MNDCGEGSKCPGCRRTIRAKFLSIFSNDTGTFFSMHIYCAKRAGLKVADPYFYERHGY